MLDDSPCVASDFCREALIEEIKLLAPRLRSELGGRWGRVDDVDEQDGCEFLAVGARPARADDELLVAFFKIIFESFVALPK